MATRALAAVLVWALLGAGVSPAAPGGAADDDTERVTVRASERYERGRVHRFLLGGGYRDLWIAPVELPLLDLEAEGGGLTPTRRFGGLQTAVLGFRGEDGRSYTFRGTDKDPSAVLPELLRDTIVQALVQDQMAAQHPGGPLAAAVLSEAAGLLTIPERMVVMPDDPRLGGFRDEFAGMVGTFYPYPLPAGDGRPGFAGALEILDQEELYAAVRAGVDVRVDARAFLRARLFDLFIGDFDRHRKQWRWVRMPGRELLQPLPEDRDMAFVRYDGWGQKIAAVYVPILQRYGPEYPSMRGLTLHGWEQDRWLLPTLDWAEWEPVAASLQAALDDDVIERAIAALPEPYAELDGERMREDVRGRRDRLLEAARAWYEHLAGEVDVQTSGAAEEVHAAWGDDGSLHVVVRAEGVAEPVFDRRFLPGETRDVRIYLRGGGDRVTVEGDPGWRIRLRVVTDDSPVRVDDSAAGCTRIYDENGSAEVAKGPCTRLVTKPYRPPPPDAGFVDVEGVPPRDWGWDLIPIPDLSYQRDVGAFLGLGGLLTRYGFRKHPWAQRHFLSGGYATEAESGRVEYEGRFRPESSRLVARLEAYYSGIEILRFYGFGNETDNDRADSFFRVRNEQVRVAPGLELPLRDGMFRVSAGPWYEYSNTVRGDRLIDELQPYGFGSFHAVGATAALRIDTRSSVGDTSSPLALPIRDNPAAGYPTSGFVIDLAGELSPELLDVEETWGSLEASAAAFVSVGEEARATLGLRVGGEHVIGTAPYFEAAFVGGSRFFSGTPTVRGFRAQRFAGESALFGNVQLRVKLARLKIVVPSDVGVVGFGDVGRVFAEGESSDVWHPSAGGGVWIAPLVRTNTLSLTVAGSREDAIVYLRLGFHY